MIIIPAAGEGRRFKEAGYKGPKHEIDLLGRPMIEWVIENVQPLDPKGEVVVATQTLIGKTEGAVHTLKRTLAGYPPRHDEPLVIANCDQLLSYDPESIINRGVGHGIIFTFKSASSAHSYVTTDRGGRITSIVEKPTVPPSNQAVSGVYYFANPSALTKSINLVYKGVPSVTASSPEQYLSTAIADMLGIGYTLYAVEAPTAILGTPEDFQRFETAADITLQAWHRGIAEFGL